MTNPFWRYNASTQQGENTQIKWSQIQYDKWIFFGYDIQNRGEYWKNNEQYINPIWGWFALLTMIPSEVAVRSL